MLCNEHNMNLTTGTTGIQDCWGRWILSCLFEQGLLSISITLMSKPKNVLVQKNHQYGLILIQPTHTRQVQVEVKASFHINNAT